mmetsp:Transcript_15974/g.46602  ORF Transcript_15974/g.46602 Transcript_15974/m.46602 type:complete len:205 (+) Transcript_15974:3-617(+)
MRESRCPPGARGAGPSRFQLDSSISSPPRRKAASGGAGLQSAQKSSLCLAQCHLAPFRRPTQPPEQVYSRYLALAVHCIVQPPLGHSTLLSTSVSSCGLAYVAWIEVAAAARVMTGAAMVERAGVVSSTAPEGVATKREAFSLAASPTRAITLKSCSPASGDGAVFTMQGTHISHSHCWQPKTTSPGLWRNSQLSQMAALLPMT